jgi:hypothetical protein
MPSQHANAIAIREVIAGAVKRYTAPAKNKAINARIPASPAKYHRDAEKAAAAPASNAAPTSAPRAYSTASVEWFCDLKNKIKGREPHCP